MYNPTKPSRAADLFDVGTRLAAAGYDPIPVCGPECATPGCASPGKAPHIKSWQSIPDTLPLFKRHNRLTNLGLRMRSNQLVLDIDANKDGWASFYRLSEQHPALPDGPQSKTGGGGGHMFFSLPPNVSLGGGGSLESIGFPGVEFKGAGGQTVEWPSMHANGSPYQWLPGHAVWEVETPQAPDWLISLVLAARSAGGPKTGPRTGSSGSSGNSQRRSRYTRQEIVDTFRQVYGEGSRRTPTGLPRLVGLIIRHGVCVACAEDFLAAWQDNDIDGGHFDPPLPDADLRNSVRTMYGRYARPEGPECRHKAPDAWIMWLTDAVFGTSHYKPPTTTVEVVSDNGDGTADIRATEVPDGVNYSDPETDPEVVAKLERYAMKVAASAIQANARATFTQLASPLESDQYFPSLTDRGELLGVSSPTLSDIPLKDPRRYLTPEQLSELLRGAYLDNFEQGERDALNVETCNYLTRVKCVDHGERKNFNRSCNDISCYRCGTKSTYKFDQAPIEDLDGDARYRTTWFTKYVLTNHKWEGEVTASLINSYELFSEVVGAVNKRKTLGAHGRVLFRAHDTHLGPRLSAVTYKLIVREDAPHAADKAIAHILSKLGDTAEVTVDRWTQSADNVRAQLRENSMTALAGMEEPTDSRLFRCWRDAVKGRKVFQGYGLLWAALQTIEEEPKKKEICDVPECGKPLYYETVPPLGANGEPGKMPVNKEVAETRRLFELPPPKGGRHV